MSHSQVVMDSAKCTPCTGLSTHATSLHNTSAETRHPWMDCPSFRKLPSERWSMNAKQPNNTNNTNEEDLLVSGRLAHFSIKFDHPKRNPLLGTSFDLALVIHLSPHSRPNAICTHQKVSFLCRNHVGVRNLSENDVDMKLELDGVCASHPRTLNRLRKTSGNVWNPCLHSILLIHWTSALQTYDFAILFSYVWRICVLTSIG